MEHRSWNRESYSFIDVSSVQPLCNSMGQVKVIDTTKQVHQPEWPVMTWHHGALTNTENTNLYYFNAENWTNYFDRPIFLQRTKVYSNIFSGLDTDDPGCWKSWNFQQRDLWLGCLTVWPYFSTFPISSKDRRYDLVLILAIETVERSMSDLGISTPNSLESVCQNLCLLKLLKQNINLFKDNLTNSAVVKEGAEEACPVQTTEMVTLEGILANSKNNTNNSNYTDYRSKFRSSLVRIPFRKRSSSSQSSTPKVSLCFVLC